MTLMAITPGTRRSYDRNPDEPSAEAPKEPAPPRRATKESSGVLRTLMIAAGSAVAAVMAVDFYRKFKGGGESEESAHSPAPAALPAAAPNQTFIPMPMPFPMPMMMGGGYGGGYGMQPPAAPPAPPSRNGGGRQLSEDEEKAELVRQVTREIRIKKAASEARRQQVDQMADDFMGDD